ncbi:MAG TPA: hypothetical protein VFT72_09290 [Opitutaceae bacterium]|nr:hypothetical protein [Opitutaceae bacterium]
MLKTYLLLTMPLTVSLITGKPVRVRDTQNNTVPIKTPTAPVTPTTPTTSPTVSYKKSDGSIDAAAYLAYATAWDSATIGKRLGPTFEALNPSAVDDRPTTFKRESKSCSLSFSNRTNPYELGDIGCVKDDDYWSDSGQVAYIPDAADDPGLDRIQTFAYYNNVFAISPRLDYASGKPHPDPQTREAYYKTLTGSLPSLPVGMVRSYGMLQNEALVIYRNGLLGVAGTQTSRAGNERPYPGLLLPANKVPTAIAISTGNEFAFITVMDTQTQKGQLAIVALEAKFLAFHTWPYMAMPNQGSWSDFKLLGYIDLPMTAPDAVAAASNGYWNGPSQTANKVLSQLKLDDEGTRKGLYDGPEAGWTGVVANKGYAIVTSRVDNKAVLVDLSPLFSYIRESYLSSAASYQATIAARGNGPNQFPLTFAEKAEITPRVVWERTLTSPTAVLAGQRVDRWSLDRYKGYIACEDGTIHILDTSSYMARFSWEKKGVVNIIGTVKVGRNPVGMAFNRFSEYPLPLLPNGADGKPQRPDPTNNAFYVACRGDRELDGVVTSDGQGQVFRRIKDSRMGDPVAVSVALRGPIISVADFAGKKILSFRVGTIKDRHDRVYPCGPEGKDKYEFAGELSFQGNPFAINSTNVN